MLQDAPTPNNHSKQAPSHTGPVMSATSEVLDKPYLLHANAVPFTADGRVLHLELAVGDGKKTYNVLRVLRIIAFI